MKQATAAEYKLCTIVGDLLFVVSPIVCRGLVFGHCFVLQYLVSFLVGKELTSCYSSIVFLVVLCSSSSLCHRLVRLISVVDVDIAPMKAYQPLQFHTLSFANIFQSRILIYAGSNLYDEIAEEKKVFESNMVILVKDINMSKKYLYAKESHLIRL